MYYIYYMYMCVCVYIYIHMYMLNVFALILVILDTNHASSLPSLPGLYKMSTTVLSTLNLSEEGVFLNLSSEIWSL